jgi:vitamin B12 transporter
MRWIGLGLWCGQGVLWAGEVLDMAAFEVTAGWEQSNEAGWGEVVEGISGEVRVDLQSRGGRGYQTDVALRGGIFEGTGVQIGGLTILDPQTGHYGLEIPLDRLFLSGARLLTGSSHALNGFNATAGSLSWEWAREREGREAGLQVGTDALLGGRYLEGRVWDGGAMAVAVRVGEGNGSVMGGDFRLEQVSGFWKTGGAGGQLRIFGGHLRKAYGWPGMYTGISRLMEFETYAVSLVGAEWTGAGHRVGGYWRYLEDDYEFNRLAPNRFFEHATQVLSVQGDGGWRRGEWGVRYRWVLVRDRILRSTSLRSGTFMGRDFGKAAVSVSRGGETRFGDWEVYAGLGLDSSEEEATSALPHFGVKAGGASGAVEWTVYAEVSGTSRVPGYTALKSAPSGLFGGNSRLGREKAMLLEAGMAIGTDWWQARAVVFQREDKALVDWVYATASPSARQAQAIDGTVDGIELSALYEASGLRVEAGYAWLAKSPQYPEAMGGSFYYLNYSQHRLALAVRKTFWQRFAVEVEASARELADNPLRGGDTGVAEVGVGLEVCDWPSEGFTVSLRGGNLFDERYERIPGTPGPGREVALGFTYGW